MVASDSLIRPVAGEPMTPVALTMRYAIYLAVMDEERIPTVESRKGAVSLPRPVSPPRSSNRTCGFPASGFPTGFIASIRRAAA